MTFPTKDSSKEYIILNINYNIIEVIRRRRNVSKRPKIATINEWTSQEEEEKDEGADNYLLVSQDQYKNDRSIKSFDVYVAI